MDKELKVFKNGKGRFKLKSYTDISGRHRKIQFEQPTSELDLHQEDAVWAIRDKETNDAQSILIVHEVKDDGVIFRDVDHGFIKDLRKFEPGEEFTVVATFRTLI